MPEIVAGMLEPGDEGPGGVERRAALECREEAGYDVDPAAVRPLGAALYASPGITDELVHYRAVETDLDRRGEACGDGSVMEEAGDVLVLGLEEALRRCLRGAIPDAKTEIGLRRLRAALGPRPRPGGPLAGDARGQGSEET
jgi:8-oxo-dGTP pyrophosphatase MutT (NUDIX family)